KGAQQPGMTGQVKEDVLSRIGELGVFVKDGKIIFNPRLLRVTEFVKTLKMFNYQTINKEEKSINLKEGSLCFTYCQVPIVYKNTNNESIKVFFTDNSEQEVKDLFLDKNVSKMIFERTGRVDRIEVSLKK
ncbi:MAG: hypothetical protein P8K12_00015, partial [Polaribacter sp.]|nr:hypothetical protein [Polaribacter sp.]